MSKKKKIIYSFFILALLASCGRKGDLLPPPEMNENLYIQKITR